MRETNTITVLGISPGTRTMGIAVLQGKELIDWRMKTKEGFWSERKLKKWLLAVDRYLWRYNVCVVAIKEIHPSRCSSNLTLLIDEIISLAQKRGVKIHRLSIEEMKASIMPKSRHNKQTLILSIAQQYPQLYMCLKREQTNENAHYVKLFEATACASIITKSVK